MAARARAVELLDYLEVGHRKHAFPRQLSGGEAQRVAIARALANKPRIILADEPTAPLDSARARIVMNLLRQIAVDQSAAIIVVTHDEMILDQFDHIFRLRDGRIEGEVAASELSRSRLPSVGTVVATPKISNVTGGIEEGKHPWYRVRLRPYLLSVESSAVPDGLTSREAADRLGQFGPNAIAEERPHIIRVLLGKFWGLIPWMLEIAIILDLILKRWVEAGCHCCAARRQRPHGLRSREAGKGGACAHASTPDDQRACSSRTVAGRCFRQRKSYLMISFICASATSFRLTSVSPRVMSWWTSRN